MNIFKTQKEKDAEKYVHEQIKNLIYILEKYSSEEGLDCKIVLPACYTVEGHKHFVVDGAKKS